MFTVVRTAPLLTVQDRGRFGYRAAGVTPSGPLDALALDVANALVGNEADAAVVEGCLGGAAFRVDRTTTFSITGAEVIATLDGAPVAAYAAHAARTGAMLQIERIVRGAVWYLAVRGGFDAPVILGSRATLVAAELGGIDGKPVRTGAQLATCSTQTGKPMSGSAPRDLRTALDDAPIPLAPAPRTDALGDGEWTSFYALTFTVSRTSSRIGYRLEGTPVRSTLGADLASEPACAGAMQLPPEGNPIVLMAEHPTIGGYPIIGVVPAHALGCLAQRAPGDTVRFTPTSIDEATAAQTRVRAALSNWVSPD